MVFGHNHNSFTDAQLDGEIDAIVAQHSMAPPGIVYAAMLSALNTCRGVYATDSVSTDAPKGRGVKGFTAYFRRVFSSEVQRLLLEAANFQAQARADQAMHQMRLEKRVAGVETAAARPGYGGSGRKPSMSEMMDAAFETQPEDN